MSECLPQIFIMSCILDLCQYLMSMYLTNHTFHTGPVLSSLLLFNPSQSHLNLKIHGYSFKVLLLYMLYSLRYCNFSNVLWFITQRILTRPQRCHLVVRYNCVLVSEKKLYRNVTSILFFSSSFQDSQSFFLCVRSSYTI